MAKYKATYHIHLALSPQHLKQRKGKNRDKKRRRGSSQLVKTGEKEHALFSVLWEEPPTPTPWWGLWAAHIWYSPTGNIRRNATKRQTRHVRATFAGQTVSPGKPRRLSGTSAPEGEWTYNCLIGQSLSTNGLFGTVIDVDAIMFLVQFGLVMDTRIIEIFMIMHKAILLEGLKNLVTCLKCRMTFFNVNFTLPKNIEHWEYIPVLQYMWNCFCNLMRRDMT